ncbi:hypothetical protein R3P38DRAFT_2783825 [Favolaschia claudopus]|uniref:Uncharacterized protein n=1 Tax=Favolaschia claudopus TaxID=2862362 RepID=A0AAW0AZK6_9AGAR
MTMVAAGDGDAGQAAVWPSAAIADVPHNAINRLGDVCTVKYALFEGSFTELIEAADACREPKDRKKIGKKNQGDERPTGYAQGSLTTQGQAACIVLSPDDGQELDAASKGCLMATFEGNLRDEVEFFG